MTGIGKRTRVERVTPVLVVDDLQRAVDFYTRKLGFEDPAVHGEPPCFAMMNRDGFDLMLSLRNAESTGRANGGDGTWDVAMVVSDIAAEIKALESGGVPIVKGPSDLFYGMREIEILDPDGHRICLAQDLSKVPATADEVWEGVLDTGSSKLRLVLKLTRAQDGSVTGRLDSPDQNATDLAVDSVARGDTTLRFEMRSIDARFEGAIDLTARTAQGQWSQRGRVWPLTLTRSL